MALLSYDPIKAFFILFKRKRWEKEQQIRKDIEEKFAAYAKKAEFDNNILRQQLSDLKQRLDTSTTTIVSLESKIREQNKSDTDIPQLLRQVRLAAEEDMKKHQAETERKHNDSVIHILNKTFNVTNKRNCH